MKSSSMKKNIRNLSIPAILLAGIAAILISFSGKPVSGSIPLSLEFMGTTFSGTYTGECKNDIPEGNGTFVAEGEKYYSYSGQWQNGQPCGCGKTDTNAVPLSVNGTMKQAVYTGETTDGKFHGTGTIAVTENGREIYRYEGEWVNGQYEGKGTLQVAMPDCVAYSYTGEWKNGLYHGEGSLIYDNPDQLQYIGRFEEGNYRPAFAQMVQSLCSSENGRNRISAEALAYLNSQESFFRNHDASEALLSSDFACEAYAESSDNPENASFRKKLKIVQTRVYEEDTFGESVTELLGYDQKGKVYLGYLMTGADSIEKGSVVTLTAYPIGYSPITNVRGEKIPAIRFMAYAAD